MKRPWAKTALLATAYILMLVWLLGLLFGRAQQPAPKAPAYTGPIQAAGTIQITNATSAQYLFTSALPANTVCAGGPLTDLTKLASLGWVVQETPSAVTISLSAPGTGTFWFICYTPYP